MRTIWKRTILAAGGIVALAAGFTATAVIYKGRHLGTVTVSNVYELVHAVETAWPHDTIIISTNGSPYRLNEAFPISGQGHLVITNSITIRGQGKNPEEVVLVGDRHRVFYVNSIDCSIENITISNGDCTTNTQGLTKGTATNSWGGGIYLGLSSNECKIANCHFVGNKALRGGGIGFYRGWDETTGISGCRFVRNEAEEHGGAIYNGGRVFNCYFSDNEAVRNGGAVNQGILKRCSSTGNKATKGADLYECITEQYNFGGFGHTTTGQFFCCNMDRARLTITNGTLFQGYFNVRNSLISDGDGVTIFRNPDYVYVTNVIKNGSAGGEELNSWIGNKMAFGNGTYPLWPKRAQRDYEISEQDGGLLKIYTVAPSLEANTIVNNKNYALGKGALNNGVISSPAIGICLFTSNKRTDFEGVNLYVATNITYYKKVTMTKGQRLAALGWEGGFGEDWMSPSGIFEVNWDILNDIVGTQTIEYKDITYSFSYTSNQMFHAMGWNGYSNSFEAASREMHIGNLSANLIESLQDIYTEEQTWGDYYRYESPIQWDGTVTEQADISDKEFNAYVLEISDSFLSPSQRLLVTLRGDGSNLEREHHYEIIWGGAWSNIYLTSTRFSPKFAGDQNQQNPYAIDLTSPAYHIVYRGNASQGKPKLLDPPTIEEWMNSAKDLKGDPRLIGGGLDIGAYQAGSYYPLVIIFK